MAIQELQDASDALRRAAGDADDSELHERLERQADQLGTLGERDRDHGPDHGRIARHQEAIRSIGEDSDGALDEQLDAANDLLNGYRETLEGV